MTQQSSVPPKQVGSHNVTPEMLFGMLLHFHRQQWSGAITVEGGLGKKSLHLVHGEIAFISSDLLDDRLGEVLYRRGVLSLDKLKTYGAQVNSSNKFGHVLLSLHSFDQVQLWNALCLQARQIVKSLFYPPRSYVEIHPGLSAQSNIIGLPGSADGTFASAFAYGRMVERFQSRVLPTTTLYMVADQGLMAREVKENSFLGDFLSLVQQSRQVEELVSKSKLPAFYTYGVIFDCWHQGLLKVEGLRPLDPLIKPTLIPLKQQIQAYNLLVQTAEHYAGLEGKKLQSASLRQLAASLLSAEEIPGFIGPQGYIDAEAAANLYCFAELYSASLLSLMKALRTLQCFLVQTAANTLTPLAFTKIREIFNQYSYQ